MVTDVAVANTIGFTVFRHQKAVYNFGLNPSDTLGSYSNFTGL